MKSFSQVVMTGAVVVALSGCPAAVPPSGPPLTQLYFPVGIAHVEVSGQEEGVLLVANANFDKRYASGSIVALQLDALGLPKLGAPPAEVQSITDLKLDASQSVQISSFAGEMAVQRLSAQSARIYVPTRSEGMAVHQAWLNIGDGGVPVLSCNNDTERDCTSLGVSLSPKEFELSDAGVPRAPSPYGVAVAARHCSSDAECCPTGDAACGRACTSGQCQGADGQPFADVWVSHITAADSPLLSGLDYRGYLVRLDSDNFAVSRDSFLPIGPGPANSLAIEGPWVFASGRILSPAPSALRALNRDGVMVDAALETVYRVSDSRGLAFSSDRKRLFIAGRVPDSLIVISVGDEGGFPFVRLLKAISLPDAPNAVSVIHRPGRGDLVAVSCSSAGSLALYDEDLGDLAAIVPQVGVQPFSVAVAQRGNGARLFVSDFGDGRIAVVDVADLNQPQRARLVAHLGSQQLCLTRGKQSPGCIGIGGAP